MLITDLVESRVRREYLGHVVCIGVRPIVVSAALVCLHSEASLSLEAGG